MADTQTETQAKGLTAPYTAFQTLKTLIKPFKEHGPPNRIDRSVLTSFSGQVGSQVLTMLKFMNLTDDDGKPTAKLRALIDAYDTDKWGPELGSLLRDSYGPLFKINLEGASSKEFDEQFRRAYPASEEVSRKSKTFFLNAARDAGIKLSTYITKNKKPRTTPAKKRAPKPNATGALQKNPAADDATAAKAAADAALAAANRTRNASEILLSLFDPKMQKAEQDAVWLLIKFFKAKGQ